MEHTQTSFHGKAALKWFAMVLIAVVLFGAVSIFAIYFVNRPDAKRVEAEQYDVFSSYIFRTPVEEQPLPVKCGEIDRYIVVNRTISTWSSPLTFLSLPARKHQAHWIPTSVFINFLMRNIRSEKIGTNFIAKGMARRKLYGGEPAQDREAGSRLLTAKFTKVGFNQDFSYAMFQAEVSCGNLSGTEYVYTARDVKHGNSWYVVRVDPK